MSTRRPPQRLADRPVDHCDACDRDVNFVVRSFLDNKYREGWQTVYLRCPFCGAPAVYERKKVSIRVKKSVRFVYRKG